MEPTAAHAKLQAEALRDMLELGSDCARRLPPELRTAEHGDLLYGANGLP
jgi:hypothetical protein